MSTTPTHGGESSEADASNIAVKGTPTTEMDHEDFFDESSIEALNWSEADEEELQLQQRLQEKRKGGKKGKGGSPPVSEAVRSIEGELAAASLEQSSTTVLDKEGTVRVLSSSLLESINTTVGSDNSAKQKVIESWASDVKDAVERGEMEYAEDEDENTVEDEEGEDKENVERSTTRVRQRKIKKKDEMSASVVSSATSDNGGDPLSNAPVLDDGPIWDKGPKRYRFEENRRINQKLTFGVLFALVLAIGLGLGNLVAYNECETEYKASMAQNQKAVNTYTAGKSVQQKSPAPQPAPEVEPKKLEIPKTVTDIPTTTAPPPVIKPKVEEPKVKSEPKPDIEVDREQYTVQMETLTKIVKTLDNLQQKIDKFENKSRQLGGVVMLKDPTEEEEGAVPMESESTTASSIIEEQVHSLPDDVQAPTIDELELQEEEEEFIMDLIDGIEETAHYLRRQDELKHLEMLEKKSELARSDLFADKDGALPDFEARTIQASFTVIKRAHEEFIRKEREDLRERKILGLALERQPEDYSPEEKAELKAKYDKFMEDYPIKAEMEVERERLKFVKESHDPKSIGLEDEIDGFFKRYDDKKDESDSSWNDLDFDNFVIPKSQEKSAEEKELDEPFHMIPAHKEKSVEGNEQDEPFHMIPEPKKEVLASSDSTSFDSSDKPKKNKADEKSEKRNKRSKTPEPESSEKKSKKSKKPKKFEGNGELDFSGSGGGDSRGRKFRDENKNRDKSDKKNKKYRRNDNEKRKFKGYELNTDFDHDDDDDDHKRKKYHNNNHHSSVSENSLGGKHQRSQEQSNWLLERTKAREEIRKDFGSKLKHQQHQHSSSGKKSNNWQVERDRLREKVRSKNERNKSFDL